MQYTPNRTPGLEQAVGALRRFPLVNEDVRLRKSRLGIMRPVTRYRAAHHA
jgi:hypothetical protein